MPNSPNLKTLFSQLPSLEAIKAEQSRRSTSRERVADEGGVKARCKTLAGFVREAWPVLLPEVTYLHNWHIDLICRHLEAITTGEMLALGLENRLLGNVPPGTMKSLLLNVFWGAWEWGPMGLAHLSTIATSFREDACMRDGRRMRALVMSPWFQAHWPLALVRSSESDFENERGGRRVAIPFKSLTNERADRLLIDDPHSVNTAESEADRKKTTLTFRESATTRLNDPVRSAIVVIMQRLHMQDISGTILELKLPYIHIMLPMRFEPERGCVTPFGRDPRTYDGELLFPERFPKEVVDRDESTMTAHAVASQNQQRPSPRGGLLFKRGWFTDDGHLIAASEVPAGLRWVRAWDFAATQKKGAAFTVGLKLGHDLRNKRFYIGNVIRQRVDNPEPLVVATAQADGRPVEISIPQDPGQAAKVQVRSIIGSLAGFRAWASPEPGEKEMRAMPVATQAEVGNVFMVEGAWNHAFLDEIESFPAGYKDQVDALSRAFTHFLSQQSKIVTPLIVTEKRTYFGDYIAG